MSNTNVVSFSVDSNFFLSPNYLDYNVVEPFEPPGTYLGDRIFVMGSDNIRPHDNEFVSMFDEDEKGTCPILPDGDYDVKLDFLPKKGIITVSFNNLNTDNTEAVINFDLKKYLSDYFVAYSKKTAGGKTQLSAKKAQEFEYSFSKKYFKNTFKEILKGNEKFWDRFHRDFDMATHPLNVHYDRQITEEPFKTVVHLTHQEYLKSKTKFGLK